jgi:hypothetical protein
LGHDPNPTKDPNPTNDPNPTKVQRHIVQNHYCFFIKIYINEFTQNMLGRRREAKLLLVIIMLSLSPVMVDRKPIVHGQ